MVTSMNHPFGKLAKIRANLEIEKCLMQEIVTKFRLSNQRLANETSTHYGQEPDRRFCAFSIDKVENETHFYLVKL